MPRLFKELTQWKAPSTKKIDNLHTEISQKYDNLHHSISRLTNQQQVQEKGKFPSPTLPNPRGVHEVSSSSEPNPMMDEVKSIITLRSGKELKQPVTRPIKEGQEVNVSNSALGLLYGHGILTIYENLLL